MPVPSNPTSIDPLLAGLQVSKAWRRAFFATIEQPYHGFQAGGFRGAAVGGAAGFVRLAMQPVATVSAAVGAARRTIRRQLSGNNLAAAADAPVPPVSLAGLQELCALPGDREK